MLLFIRGNSNFQFIISCHLFWILKFCCRFLFVEAASLPIVSRPVVRVSFVVVAAVATNALLLNCNCCNISIIFVARDELFSSSYCLTKFRNCVCLVSFDFIINVTILSLEKKQSSQSDHRYTKSTSNRNVHWISFL